MINTTNRKDLYKNKIQAITNNNMLHIYHIMKNSF